MKIEKLNRIDNSEIRKSNYLEVKGIGNSIKVEHLMILEMDLLEHLI